MAKQEGNLMIYMQNQTNGWVFSSPSSEWCMFTHPVNQKITIFIFQLLTKKYARLINDFVPHHISL